MIFTSTMYMYLVECRQGKFLKDSIYHVNNIFELKKTKQSKGQLRTKCMRGN